MDVFGTAALRDRVVAAWTASPARFREDANAEEELARGAYRDRVVVELAQNAADAGRRAGRPARLLLRLGSGSLLAANTGVPVDAAGVEGLSTLRASTKRDGDTVGRFGVGFAAVLAVTDDPRMYTASGAGVRWSRADAQATAAAVPGLAGELELRGHAVPVLRLPFAAQDPAAVPPGYDTAVVLPLRDDAAARLVRRLLDDVDDALLLALPDLAEVTVDVDGAARTIGAQPPETRPDGLVQRRIGDRTWWLSTHSGVAADDLLADRPFEERSRPAWSVTVAVPVEHGTVGALPSSVAGVLHAPTPTDDRTDLPALVIAGLPLDSSRRRVASGPLTDHLVDRIGEAYAALVAALAPAVGPAAADLVPGPLGVDAVDAQLHRAVRAALAATPFVPAVDGGSLRPVEVRLVDGLTRVGDVAILARAVPGLPARSWWRDDVPPGLGATVTPLADVVDDLAGLDLDPAGWRALYDELDGSDPEALGALPVPLADGRVVRGPRGLLLPGDVDPLLLAPFRLRVVAADAVHPLLGRLGAVAATAASVLRDPMVQSAVDSERAVDAVLSLVAESGLTWQDEPWLAELALPDATGELGPARDLLLPGSAMLAVLDADPDEFTVATDLVTRFGPAVLRAVGVRDGFAVVRDTDVPLDPDTEHDLDAEDAWIDTALRRAGARPAEAYIAEFQAVADLDLVRDDAWPDVLSWLAADPDTRAAVVEPALITLVDGTRRAVPSYTSWWLRHHAVVDGCPLNRLSLPDADPAIRALLPVARVPVDDVFAAAVGLVRTLADADPNGLLEQLAEADLSLAAPDLAAVYADLARRDPSTVWPPDRLRVLYGAGSRVVPAEEAVVCDGPHWLQLGLSGVVRAPRNWPRCSTPTWPPTSWTSRCPRVGARNRFRPQPRSYWARRPRRTSSTTTSVSVASTSTGGSTVRSSTRRRRTAWLAGWRGWPGAGTGAGCSPRRSASPVICRGCWSRTPTSSAAAPSLRRSEAAAAAGAPRRPPAGPTAEAAAPSAGPTAEAATGPAAAVAVVRRGLRHRRADATAHRAGEPGQPSPRPPRRPAAPQVAAGAGVVVVREAPVAAAAGPVALDVGDQVLAGLPVAAVAGPAGGRGLRGVEAAGALVADRHLAFGAVGGSPLPALGAGAVPRVEEARRRRLRDRPALL
ncbi:sacsin N-terminal ATP-binding-like domain-containing protein [Jiangella gansuensis]|uniref:sacsin N-terminal ATP-binding-like domain-containing protein n=1 Tax=Jiangella gansuensis TaxID=281473 RepID=UPI0004B3ADCE|nr:hypothetical protein [Jiangella gansuensis]